MFHRHAGREGDGVDHGEHARQAPHGGLGFLTLMNPLDSALQGDAPLLHNRAYLLTAQRQLHPDGNRRARDLRIGDAVAAIRRLRHQVVDDRIDADTLTASSAPHFWKKLRT